MPAAKEFCPNCGPVSVPSGSLGCPNCSTPFPASDPSNSAVTLDLDTQSSISQGTVEIPSEQVASRHIPTAWTRLEPQPAPSTPALTRGAIIGARYEILNQIGEGGMGAVYRAQDRELDRVVALKVIRPELAGKAEVLRMFKQELILARQVTHRNVIRIYDLGAADNLRFITMEFVEGQDLKSVMKAKGKFTPVEAAELTLAVAEGLEAAHAESVVHRDLKPQNIMIDKQGRVLVMDFGLALSTESGDSSGTLRGTPDYMSPEQAQSKEVDGRSDLFTVGLILYELLTGVKPFKADTLPEILRRRIHETAKPPIELDPTLPKALNDIVIKCLAVNPADRYQSAGALAHDLKLFLGIIKPSDAKKWKITSIAAAAAAVAALGIVSFNYFNQEAPPPKTVTMLVADFANKTGEPVLDGTLEPLFGLAMEGASFVNAFNRVQARQIAAQVQPGATALDANIARLVAVREGLNVVVTGSIEKSGSAYRVQVQALDPATGKILSDADSEAGNKEAILTSIPRLAQPIRKSLGDTNLSSKLDTGETFTAASLDAAFHYSRGQEAQLLGKYDDAIKSYSAAIAADPNFGRAYSGLGVVFRNLGQREEADKYLKLALSKIGQMSERERYRTRGAYYVLRGAFTKAREEYSALVKQYPSDSAGHANLAIAHLYLRNLAAAMDEGRKAVEIYPKNVGQRLNLALYSLYAGDFAGAKQQSLEVLKLNPKFDRAFLVQALAEMGQSNPSAARAHYDSMRTISPRGASVAALGLADLLLYQGSLTEAEKVLREGLAIDLAAKDRAAVAKKHAALAYVQLRRNNLPRAAAEVDTALENASDETMQFSAALLYLQAGAAAKARALRAQLEQRLETIPQAYARLIAAEDLARSGKPAEAIKVFNEARQMVDTWIGHYLLGRTYLDAGAFAEADSEFDICWKRRGEGTDLYFDYAPTTRYLPIAQYNRARSLDGLSSPAAQDAFKSFLAMRSGSEADAQVLDARKRVGRN
jgi:serine/threonine protein kinase/tetratricopeptide (TPR) repeat protein